MRHRQFALALALAGAAAGLAGGAAAKQGDISVAKTIAIMKVRAVRISGLRDFIFPASQMPPAPLERTLCIFSSEAGRYTVTAAGGSGAGAFRLQSAAGAISYSVSWYDSAAGGSPVTLQPQQPSPLMGGADRQNETCNGTPNARLRIALNTADFTSAQPATYADVLTLLIAAN
jgi:hypothetical protein